MEERAALDGLQAALRDAKNEFARPANANTSTISINAGGLAVWIATTCAIVMLACNVFLAAIVMSNNREISDLNDKLSAIYMLAPHLQPTDQGVAAK